MCINGNCFCPIVNLPGQNFHTFQTAHAFHRTGLFIDPLASDSIFLIREHLSPGDRSDTLDSRVFGRYCGDHTEMKSRFKNVRLGIEKCRRAHEGASEEVINSVSQETGTIFICLYDRNP